MLLEMFDGTTVTMIPIKVTIRDSLPQPTLTADSTAINVDEDVESGNVDIPLTLSSKTTETVTVTYSTSIEAGDTAEQADFMVQTDMLQLQ